MSRHIDRVLALISRAINPAATIEEARSSAFAAIQIIHKYKLEIHDTESLTKFLKDSVPADNYWVQPYVDNSPEYVDPPAPSGIPDFNPDTFKEVTLFRITLADNIGICAKCHEKYNRGEPIAQGSNKGKKTHFRCKTFFAE